MGKNNNRQVRQLLRRAGNNLSAREAQRIERRTGVSADRVVAIAQRNDNIGVNVPTKTVERVQAIVQSRPPAGASSQPSAPSGADNPSLDAIRAERDSAYGELDSYKQELANTQDRLGSIGAEYEAKFSSLSQQYNEALSGRLSAESQLGSARAEAEAEKKRAAELEKMRADERELSINQQLGGLRSGSVASGGGYTGLGSLSSGRQSYSIATGGKSGGVLDRAYQDIDPTDSVLNKKVAVDAVSSMGSRSGSRAMARRRALASGGAGSYYANRFG